MKSVIHKTICVICFAASVLMYNSASAGGPAGEIRTLPSEVKRELVTSFAREGYGCDNLSIDECLQRNIVLYLTNNQYLLARPDYPEERVVDLVICIMTAKGNTKYRSFPINESFINWCRGQLKSF